MKRYIKKIFPDGSYLIGVVISESNNCLVARCFINSGAKINHTDVTFDYNEAGNIHEFPEEEAMLEIL